jgi:hypothetical protein
MLTQIHFLLTYTCTFECDHCFLYCSPRSVGTFTAAQIRELLSQARALGTVERVYFEGGEPFLFHPRLARAAGLETGVVTNCYWATAREDAALWLAPLARIGLDDLSVSDDAFHHGEGQSPARTAADAAGDVGLSAGAICIEGPTLSATPGPRGEPVVGGGALFKGRAADRLTAGLPGVPPQGLITCPHEELIAPGRVHVDAFGNVHVCQGVSIGNLWQRPLSALLAAHDDSHPICGPLSRGGPAELARTHGVDLEGPFVDECHYCFLVRRALLDRFPSELAPRQVYGEEC